MLLFVRKLWEYYFLFKRLLEPFNDIALDALHISALLLKTCQKTRNIESVLTLGT